MSDICCLKYVQNNFSKVSVFTPMATDNVKVHQNDEWMDIREWKEIDMTVLIVSMSLPCPWYLIIKNNFNFMPPVEW